MHVSVFAMGMGKKLKAPSKPRTRKQEAAVSKLDALKASIYGATGAEPRAGGVGRRRYPETTCTWTCTCPCTPS